MEVTDLMNSWAPLRRSINGLAGYQFDIFISVPLCLKLIALTWLVHCGAFNAAALSLVFENLPVCVFPMIKNLGIIPENSLPISWWQIAFCPLELLTLWPPMIMAGYNFHTLVAGLEMLRYCADELRFV